MPEIRIGISGWTYAPWRGTFFPKGLAHRRELEYASRKVSSIEINGTFYSLQTPSSYAKWAAETPDDFLFSVKGPRFITHILRLKAAKVPLANFFASGVLRLGTKLGPILWQLPPSFRYDPARLAEFFSLLPRDTAAATRLAALHNEKVKQPWFEPVPKKKLRHALEVRHATFVTPDFVALLRKHDIALVVADTVGKWPFMEDVTSDFVYVRLHGDAELYVSGYTDKALREWARKVAAWSRGRTPRGTKLTGPSAKPNPAGRGVYVYFDNDVKTRAPYDAINLAHELGLGPKAPPAPPVASIPAVARTNWPGYPSRPTRAAAK
jgi:uncharacterized protein YecE (DUF72 family)